MIDVKSGELSVASSKETVLRYLLYTNCIEIEQ